jgi:predicted HD superfamily hydrolase involved in NAD metabolism
MAKVHIDSIETRLRQELEALPANLRAHIQRVEAEAVRLAGVHGLDQHRARLAALGHDLVRHKQDAELLALAQAYELQPDAIETASPILIHGPVAARILSRDLCLTDAEVLAAVAWHTTARAGMSQLEMALFVADKTEPEKLARDPTLQQVRTLGDADLSAAVLRYLDLYMDQALQRRLLLHPRTLEARNQLLTAGF